jgi:hypothetical protein
MQLPPAFLHPQPPPHTPSIQKIIQIHISLHARHQEEDRRLVCVPLPLLPVPGRGEEAGEEPREGGVADGPAHDVAKVEVDCFLDGLAEEVGGEEEGEEEEEDGEDDLRQGPPELEPPKAIGTDTFKFPPPGVVVSVEPEEEAADLDFEEDEAEGPCLVVGEEGGLVDWDTGRDDEDEFEEEAEEEGEEEEPEGEEEEGLSEEEEGVMEGGEEVLEVGEAGVGVGAETGEEEGERGGVLLLMLLSLPLLLLLLPFILFFLLLMLLLLLLPLLLLSLLHFLMPSFSTSSSSSSSASHHHTRHPRHSCCCRCCCSSPSTDHQNLPRLHHHRAHQKQKQETHSQIIQIMSRRQPQTMQSLPPCPQWHLHHK